MLKAATLPYLHRCKTLQVIPLAVQQAGRDDVTIRAPPKTGPTAAKPKRK